MVRQLGAVSSEIAIETIVITMESIMVDSVYKRLELIRDLCRSIDSILTGGKFPSLARYYVSSEIRDYFPKLQEAGIVLQLW